MTAPENVIAGWLAGPIAPAHVAAPAIISALAAAGYEVVPAGTADRLAALTDDICRIATSARAQERLDS
jgi:hypothetical protein